MVLKNYEIVLFSGDFIEFMTPIVTLVAVFLTYYLTKKEFKFKNYYEREIEILCELYGMLEELKYLITKTVLNSDKNVMNKNLEESNEIYQRFNLFHRRKSIFIDSDLFEDIKKFEDTWLKTYAKTKNALLEKRSTNNEGWNKEYFEAAISILGGDLEKILTKIHLIVRKKLN